MKSYAEYIADQSRDCAIVAHRAAWHDAPENSLLAIEHAIAAGYDIVEIDVRESADGELFLTHDDTLMRMAGRDVMAEQLTMAELQSTRLRLRDGGQTNAITDETIPTLRQVLEAIKGKVYVDLDLKDRELFPRVAALAKEVGVAHQVDLKRPVHTAEDVAWLGRFPEIEGIAMLAMARVNAEDIDPIADVLETIRPFVCEIKFDSLATIAARRDRFAAMGTALWVNTLDPVSCCGLTDSAALVDPDAIWGALIRAGVSAIQTDEPEALKAYLEARRA